MAVINYKVSESKSTLNAPPESPCKSKSPPVIWVSTYALIDCWVATAVALLELKLSWSKRSATTMFFHALSTLT